MQFDYFRIRNFKGIRELSIHFDHSPSSPVITLVGLNESGKTTILEALSFFMRIWWTVIKRLPSTT